ncbi:hypothetical protein HPO96_32700 [Kribbella sandramycini]|uniref:Uncharacterized protein n=1 Tax=Kribbella sandramycini TaxID=60450 RepID=A0A7Y4P3F9_9ACTN|nr:hypothetical protein [Kribbella sandramycini]MBB6566017.1 hypothetical protein [Kribbella sandramycini]NOL45018.1 hypothetical protein [Kribbella sandramycini]
MPELTDDQLGSLLRETFTDHQADVDTLPEATKSRRRLITPALVAAAVLSVVAGSVYAVRNAGPDAEAPVASPSSPTAQFEVTDDDTKVWTLSAQTLAKGLKPAAGWEKLILQGLRDSKTGPEPVIEPKQRRLIALMTSDHGPAEWRGSAPLPPELYQECDNDRIGLIELGKITKVGDTRVLRVRLTQSCHGDYTATYTLVKDPSFQSRYTVWMLKSTSNVVQSIR